MGSGITGRVGGKIVGEDLHSLMEMGQRVLYYIFRDETGRFRGDEDLHLAYLLFPRGCLFGLSAGIKLGEGS